MTDFRVHIELTYPEAVKVSRLLKGYIRMKTLHSRCLECRADFLMEHPHAPGCAVELAERILKDMDPPEPLNLWRMIVSAWRMRHEH